MKGIFRNTTKPLCLVPLVFVISALASNVNAGAPTVTDGGASSISTGSAYIIGSVNPNGLATTYWINWGLTASYGYQVSEPYFSIPAQTSKEGISWPLTGLSPNTTYHWQLVANNSAGTIPGNDTNFTTLPFAPTVSTAAAAFTNAFSAGLSGNVNPNGTVTTAWYQWGLDPSCSNSTAAISVGSQNSSVNVPQTVTNLSPNTTYYYQVAAGNRGGTNIGIADTFTTSAPPPPIIQSVAWQAGEISFSWQSIAGQTYQVEYSNDLINWSDTCTPLPANSTFYDLVVGQCRFYRVVLLP